jgi:hypothetical protein
MPGVAPCPAGITCRRRRCSGSFATSSRTSLSDRGAHRRGPR